MATQAGYWWYYGRITTGIYLGLTVVAISLAVAAVLSHVLTLR